MRSLPLMHTRMTSTVATRVRLCCYLRHRECDRTLLNLELRPVCLKNPNFKPKRIQTLRV